MNSHGWYCAKVLAAATIVAVLAKLAQFNAVGCDAFDRDRADYMAYCNSDRHGHYDHAAFIYDLEPGVRTSIDSANVLFVGSSHIQVAFSSDALVAFEKANPTVRPYVMGFGYFEQDIFSAAVVRKLHPAPRVLVINVDPFFSDSASVEARRLLQNPGVERANAIAKKVGHAVANRLCADTPRSFVARRVCGNASTLYRSRNDGRWIFQRPRPFLDTLTTPAFNPGADELARFASNAERYLKGLPVERSCVVITLVPDGAVPESVARDVAARIGATFIAPHLDHLGSSDGSHLDTESGERWSAAFLAELEPLLKRCL
jgi:hypothetical protein